MSTFLIIKKIAASGLEICTLFTLKMLRGKFIYTELQVYKRGWATQNNAKILSKNKILSSSTEFLKVFLKALGRIQWGCRVFFNADSNFFHYMTKVTKPRHMQRGFQWFTGLIWQVKKWRHENELLLLLMVFTNYFSIWVPIPSFFQTWSLSVFK